MPYTVTRVGDIVTLKLDGRFHELSPEDAATLAGELFGVTVLREDEEERS